jgi:transcriptional regulator with PAS, ATPase and Fis domain
MPGESLMELCPCQASCSWPSLAEQPDYELHRLQKRLQGTVSSGGLIGTSTPMRAVQEMIAKTVDHRFPVIILGETGTGKELAARSIHYSGRRRHKPFVPVNCSSLTATLFESELFGYVRGAFTGATNDKRGLFEAADTGTLFLDEIGDLPKELQPKLLRVIQEREVRRIGSTEEVPIDVRVVVATNRDLKQAVEEGTFRGDLYFRLNVIQITVPPLREHLADIPLLVAAFLIRHSDPTRAITRVAEEFWAEVMAYDWPGNVRELENLVECSIALGSGPVLRNERHCLLRRGGDEDEDVEPASVEPWSAMQRRAVLSALRETGGDKLAAARRLGIGKTTLYRKLKEYGPDGASQRQISSKS